MTEIFKISANYAGFIRDNNFRSEETTFAVVWNKICTDFMLRLKDNTMVTSEFLFSGEIIVDSFIIILFTLNIILDYLSLCITRYKHSKMMYLSLSQDSLIPATLRIRFTSNVHHFIISLNTLLT